MESQLNSSSGSAVQESSTVSVKVKSISPHLHFEIASKDALCQLLSSFGEKLQD
jgi:hypothetical protein